MLAAGAAFGIVRALRAAPADAALFPGGGRVALAAAAMVAALAALARSWAAVLARRAPRRRLVGAFYASQLAKYLPGGIWQPLGLVGAARGGQLSASRTAAGFAVFAGVYAGTGAALGGVGLAATAGHLPVPARLLLALGAAGLLAAHRPTLVRAVGLLPSRLAARLPDDLIPAQRSLTTAAGLAAVGLVAWGAAFATLLAPLAPGASPVPVAAAAIAAWVAGFVAVPVPAGVGVREAALVALLPGAAAPIVAASVLHRAAGLAAELVLLAGHGAAAGRTDREEVAH